MPVRQLRDAESRRAGAVVRQFAYAGAMRKSQFGPPTPGPAQFEARGEAQHARAHGVGAGTVAPALSNREFKALTRALSDAERRGDITTRDNLAKALALRLPSQRPAPIVQGFNRANRRIG